MNPLFFSDKRYFGRNQLIEPIKMVPPYKNILAPENGLKLKCHFRHVNTNYTLQPLNVTVQRKSNN